MIELLAVAVHADKRAENIKGAKISVIGVGHISILVSQAAKAMCEDKMMMTDIRLNNAKECGIDYCINTKQLILATLCWKVLALIKLTQYSFA